MLSNDELSFSLSFAFHLDNIIDKGTYSDIQQRKGRDRAVLLVNSLEQAITRQDDMLPRILDKMDKVDPSLHDIVLKMRSEGKKEEQDLTGY